MVRERTDLPYSRRPTNTCRKDKTTENRWQANITITIVANKDDWWILKSAGKVMIRNRSSILMKQVFSIFRNRPRYLLIRYVLITNGKSSIFTGEKPGRYHPTQGPNWTDTLTSCSPSMSLQGGQSIIAEALQEVLAPNARSQSNREKTSEKPKVRDRLWNN